MPIIKCQTLTEFYIVYEGAIGTLAQIKILILNKRVIEIKQNLTVK